MGSGASAPRNTGTTDSKARTALALRPTSERIKVREVAALRTIYEGPGAPHLIATYADTLWPGAVLLAKYLEARPADLRGATVVD